MREIGNPPGGRRAFAPEQLASMIRAHHDGVGATELARRYGVSRRTVYRWLDSRLVDVTVGGWTARFAIRTADDNVREGPVQIGPWRREP